MDRRSHLNPARMSQKGSAHPEEERRNHKSQGSINVLSVAVHVPNQVFFRNTSAPTQEKDHTLVLPVDFLSRPRATYISTASPMHIASKQA